MKAQNEALEKARQRRNDEELKEMGARKSTTWTDWRFPGQPEMEASLANYKHVRDGDSITHDIIESNRNLWAGMKMLLSKVKDIELVKLQNHKTFYLHLKDDPTRLVLKKDIEVLTTLVANFVKNMRDVDSIGRNATKIHRKIQKEENKKGKDETYKKKEDITSVISSLKDFPNLQLIKDISTLGDWVECAHTPSLTV